MEPAMTEAEAAALVNAGAGIDSAEAQFNDAAAAGLLDERGNVMAPAPIDEDAAAREWLFVPEIIAMIATAILPETASHYTDAHCMTLARKFVPVAEKYGWQGSSASPEIGLGLATLAFAAPAMFAYRTRKAHAVAVEVQQTKDPMAIDQAQVLNGSRE